MEIVFDCKIAQKRAKMLKLFACGANKLKNKGLGVYFYYKQPKIGAVGAENFEVFLVF